MWKRFTILLAVALAVVGCSHGVSRIRTGVLPSPNPTSYSFALPVEEVHAKALQAFSRDHQYKEPVFKQPPSTDYWCSTLLAECSTNALCGKAVFNDPANARDIYLHSSGTPFAISAVYRGRDGGLPFFSTFHVHLADNGPGTVVTVSASDAQVVNGMKSGLGSCGLGRHWNYVKVRPTTVEEYTVLAYLGRYLGVSNMPAVVAPSW
jgi:hypothetical protein